MAEASLHGLKEVTEFLQEPPLPAVQRGVVIVVHGLQRRFVLVVTLSAIAPHLLPFATAAHVVVDVWVPPHFVNFFARPFLVADKEFAAPTQSQNRLQTLEARRPRVSPKVTLTFLWRALTHMFHEIMRGGRHNKQT